MKAAVLITVPVWKDWLPVLRFRAGMAEKGAELAGREDVWELESLLHRTGCGRLHAELTRRRRSFSGAV